MRIQMMLKRRSSIWMEARLTARRFQLLQPSCPESLFAHLSDAAQCEGDPLDAGGTLLPDSAVVEDLPLPDAAAHLEDGQGQGHLLVDVATAALVQALPDDHNGCQHLINHCFCNCGQT